MAKPLLKIDCNDSVRKNLSRFLALFYPVWGLLAAGLFVIWCSNGGPPENKLPSMLFTYASPFLLFGGYAASIALLRPILMADRDRIYFPGPLMRKVDFNQLRRIRMSNDNLCFEFEYHGKSKSVRLALKRLKESDRLRFLDFLYEHAGSCQIDEQVKMELERSLELESFDRHKMLRIPYESHSKRKAFFDICLSYEKFFWSVWISICGLAGIFIVPFVVGSLLWAIHRAFSPNTPFNIPFIEVWIKVWMAPFEVVARPSYDLLSAIGKYLYENPWACLVLAVLAASILIQAGKLLGKARAINVDREGIGMDCNIPGLRNAFHHWTLWSQIKSLKLAKCNKKATETQLQFLGRDEKILLNFDLEGISKAKHKRQLKEAIEAWAPHLELDAGFLETAESNARQGYTELWLQSLNMPPKRDRLSPLKSGDKLQSGQYRILEMVGAGGQGVAYLAERILSDGKIELVVVKEFVLPVYVDRRARQLALERFEQESRTLSSLSHDNIVGLKDHFIEDHRAYLVLERVRGSSLRKLAADGGMTDEMLLESVLKQMCRILAYLQEQSPPLVHRDFTPDNLLLDDSGVLKLIDFNLARQDAGKSRLSVVGKHAYMPPEQFAGKATVQSDIYALGATLYYCLSGTDPEPFSQSGLPPACVNINPVLGEIIQKCTALDQNKRFQSAREIEDCLSGNQSKSVVIDLAEKELLNG